MTKISHAQATALLEFLEYEGTSLGDAEVRPNTFKSLVRMGLMQDTSPIALTEAGAGSFSYGGLIHFQQSAYGFHAGYGLATLQGFHFGGFAFCTGQQRF